MEFEWDDEKDRSNQLKHGVSFDHAAEVFLDPHRLEDIDDRFNYGEERLTVIGMVSVDVLFVVATERRDAVLRIISARYATRGEEKRYFLHRAEE